MYCCEKEPNPCPTNGLSLIIVADTFHIASLPCAESALYPCRKYKPLPNITPIKIIICHKKPIRNFCIQ